MAGEQFYYANNSFAFRIDDDGRIIDTMSGQAIGICTKKKDEILNDYNALANENKSLKTKIESIENLLEKYKGVLPEEIAALIARPPSVESLQSEISELKSMMAMLIKQGGVSVDNNTVMQKPRIKSGNTKGSRSEINIDGDKLEQSQ